MGAEKTRGIPIDLDKVRYLKFNHNAIAVLEECAGLPVTKLFANVGDTMGFDMVRKMLYAGILHEDHALRRRPREDGLWFAGELIDQSVGDTHIERLAYVQGKISEALAATFGSGEKKVETPDPVGALNGTGTTPSGQPSVSAG